MGYHLYGVVRAGGLEGTQGEVERPFLAPAAAGEPLPPTRLLVCGANGALVSPLAAPRAVASPAELLHHFEVLRRAVEIGPVLPFRFGVVLPDTAAVRRLLERHARAFEAEFARLGDQVEASVAFFWSREEALRRLRAQGGTRRALDRLTRLTPARQQPVLVEMGRRVAAIVDTWRARAAPRLEAALRQVAAEVVFLEPVGVRMLLNAACLVERERVPELAAAVQGFAEAEGNLQPRLRAPLPPFTFTRMVLSTSGETGNAGA